ncbi:MAG: S-layer homology domain-containing protein [Eubacteriales bacterium]
MRKIKGFRLKKLLAAVIGLSMICGLLNMAAPQWAGAAEPVALTVTGDGVEKTVQFTLAELQALPQKTYTYSGYNHWPSLQIFKDMKGPMLKTLLDAAGLKDNAAMIRCKLSVDVYSEFTKEQLLDEKRYYFPDGEDEDNLGKWPPTRSERGKSPVETMLALNESNGKLIYGQRALNEPTCCKNQMLGGLCEGGTIEVLTESLAHWEAPSANPAPGTIAPGTEVTLQHGDGTPYHAIVYYTLDGSDPTYGSNIFNISYPHFQQQLNKPVPINKNMTIKTKTIGMGKLDSEVATYQYNTGVPTQPDEVNENTAGNAENTTKPENTGVTEEAPAAGNTEQARNFTDLEGHWAKDDIYSLAEKGIIGGMTATEFKPEEKITRAQFAKLLIKALNIEVKKDAVLSFSDVPAGAWYHDCVAAAVSAGLITGYSDSIFAPDNDITREQMAVILSRALTMKLPAMEVGDSTGQAIDKFTDKGDISSWAREGIALAVSSGIVSGVSADTFAPKAFVTRAQAAVMISRLYNKLN